jgi:selenocysteine insertion sequence-binding protein 2
MAGAGVKKSKLSGPRASLVDNPNQATAERQIRRRRKEREIPKAKKLTKLKKIILQERAQEQQNSSCISESTEPAMCPQNVVTTASLTDGTSTNVENMPNSTLNEYKRPYIKQQILPELNQAVRKLLAELVRFQQRLEAKDPDKARQKRRLLSGLREVLRTVQRGKAKCVIIAPNIEHITAAGGLEDHLQEIVKQCKRTNTFLTFAMTRNTLGKAIGKRLRVSVVAILDFSGAEELYKQVTTLTLRGRAEWRKMQQENTHAPQTNDHDHANNTSVHGNQGSSLQTYQASG